MRINIFPDFSNSSLLKCLLPKKEILKVVEFREIEKVDKIEVSHDDFALVGILQLTSGRPVKWVEWKLNVKYERF